MDSLAADSLGSSPPGTPRGLVDSSTAPGAGPVPPLGLALAHNWPQREENSTAGAEEGEFRLILALGGAVVRLSEVGVARTGFAGGGQRGQVQGFSRSSRLNMLEQINQIDRERVASVFFCSNTAPRGEMDWRRVERNRAAWLKRFWRRWGRSSCFIVWKKEPHETSGQPHLHALIFWLTKPPHLVKEFRPWNDQAWAEVVASEQFEKNRDFGCTVIMMKSWNGVASYTAKYLAKDQEALQSHTGRVWGIENRAMMPRRLVGQVLSREVGKKTRRTLVHLQRRRREYWLVEGRRVYAQKVYAEGRLVKIISVADLVVLAKSAGLRVTRRRPKILRCRDVPIWADVIEDNGRRHVERLDNEKHSFCPSRHFVSSALVDRLVKFYEGQLAARPAADGVPF